jgi:uncharacterized protein YcbK (DUF882 family)
VNQRSADSLAASRRRFLKVGAAAVACSAFAPTAALAAKIGGTVERKLAFHNLHTGERLSLAYWSNGTYRPDALGEINQILRDWRTGDVIDMDVRLVDLLWELHQKLGSTKPFDVISGYRSPKTNATLASASSGVAKKSLHMRGMAIDIALPDKKLQIVRQTAMGLQRGGVGYYPKSGFVHVDVGPVRFW